MASSHTRAHTLATRTLHSACPEPLKALRGRTCTPSKYRIHGRWIEFAIETEDSTARWRQRGTESESERAIQTNRERPARLGGKEKRWRILNQRCAAFAKQHVPLLEKGPRSAMSPAAFRDRFKRQQFLEVLFNSVTSV